MKKKNVERTADKIAEEIRSLLLNALNRKGWYFFKNPYLVKCWEEMNCKNTTCPSYKSSNLRCWQVSGTLCGGEPQGEFAKKIDDCHQCRVYKKATEGDVILQIGEDFNNLMFQLKNKEDELKRSIRDSEEKNRELVILNKKIKKDCSGNWIKKNIQLKELSIKDELTGLHNYRFFTRVIKEQYKLSRRYSFPLSCIMIDIDYFKAINDTYGHQVGDVILKHLADILKSNVRDTDKVVRYGGEEFAIILPHTSQEAAYIKAEKLRKLVSDYVFKVHRKSIGITISAGIATYSGSKDIKRAEHLVSCADKALYQAKEGGRNQSVIYNNKTVLKEEPKKTDIEGKIREKRKYPRIQTLIEVKGKIDEKELTFYTVFDISCSGLCVLSEKQIDGNNKFVKMKLYLPRYSEKTKKPLELELEGAVVRCESVDGFAGNHSDKKYVIGIQFINMSERDKMSLQRYFVSIFERNTCV
jgi:diguanylate cyclase (GGDEF)-like protein